VGSNPKDLGIAIGNANEDMMRNADIIIANVQPWRGPEADSGTSYEIGFMAAQAKLVVLHTNDPRGFADRVIVDIYGGKVHQDGLFKRGDSDNMMIEDFPGFADNLMLVNAAVKSIQITTGETPDPASVVQRSF
jgi:nucleoside 2-deoxyribosyltransferase